MSILSIEAFNVLIKKSIDNNVDFILISGDLFNTSLPSIDYMKEVVKGLQKLKEFQIKVYLIPGSHDFSPSGKTMLSVLEEAKLVVNVSKFKEIEVNKTKKKQLKIFKDEKTGAFISGMLGKKNMLEKNFYENLDYSNFKENISSENMLEKNTFNIFMFHTALDELKPKELSKMESSPISLLPQGFDYYAGGHVHIVEKSNVFGYRNVVYPGPLFPNSFYELEKLRSGGFYFYDNGTIGYHKIVLKDVIILKFDCNNKTPEEISEELKSEISNLDVNEKIVLFRFFGKLKIGKPSDINTQIIQSLYDKGAYFIMKNSAGVLSQEFEEVKKDFQKETVEEEIIEEHLGQTKVQGLDFSHEKEIILKLMKVLASEQDEGETKAVYEERILKDVDFIENL